MSEPTAIAEIIGTFRYLDDLRVKYCPSVFQEISEYHPIEQPAPSREIITAREMRERKQMKDENYFDFWKQPINQEFLEKKYQAEKHNRDCHNRLKELERDCIDKDMMRELTAVKTKREHFEKFIRGYSEKPLAIFN